MGGNPLGLVRIEYQTSGACLLVGFLFCLFYFCCWLFLTRLAPSVNLNIYNFQFFLTAVKKRRMHVEN